MPISIPRTFSQVVENTASMAGRTGQRGQGHLRRREAGRANQAGNGGATEGPAAPVHDPIPQRIRDTAGNPGIDDPLRRKLPDGPDLQVGVVLKRHPAASEKTVSSRAYLPSPRSA